MKKPFAFVLLLVVVGILGALILSKKEDLYALKEFIESEE